MENGVMGAMMSSENKEICDGCGKSALLQDMQGNEFCDSCGHLARIIKAEPQLLRKICGLIRSDLHAHEGSGGGEGEEVCPAGAPLELPEVLDAVRYRTRDRELNTWYVSVSELQGNPVEIFASTAFDRDHHLQSRISNLTTITRLVSLVLRHVFLGEVLSLEKTIKQLHRSSRQQNDLPDMLTRVLSRYTRHPGRMDDDIDESDQDV